ncbi:hypothetical protein [Saccharothrix luteola]|uniref:hypothetical protein n=1 Tax=Saccharothrix luteola TaxID=2893018 RepID=UPI001E305A9B|nr:hypothetical protein [Saccharothrix luteola]MCC8247671.1 hypothetical protein [Saccharothrix luteola]
MLRCFVSGTPEHPNQDAVGRVEPGQVVAEHVSRTADLLLERSQVPAERVDAGRTAVVDLCYRLADGSAHVVAARGLEHVPTT